MKTLFKYSLLSLALLAGAFTAQAQVKIGTSPTTIDPKNNLEVQGSTAGRKFSVDKGNGKVTIADGTEGDGKVLTSDASGGASWQYPLSGSMVKSVGNGGLVYLDAANTTGFTGASITFPKSGTYLVYANFQVAGSFSVGTSAGHGFVNTVASTSASTFAPAGEADHWWYIIYGATYSAPGFPVTVTTGQTLYFWFWGGYLNTTYIKMNNAYAVGPF